jgi:hypothetical protein
MSLSASERKKLLARKELKPALDALRAEFQRGRLTLYLGAGVSRDSGLPNWNTLVASLYYSAVNKDWNPEWIAFPNYLYALGEWLLTKSGEAPEVIAGKVENYYGSSIRFAEELKRTLYLPWQQIGGAIMPPPPQQLRHGNALVDSVATLCEATVNRRGLHAVVTTNYDSLLEQSLSQGSAKDKFQAIWKSAEKLSRRKKPVFHVHGYLPADGRGSPYEEIMLTEAQYHGAASDPYSWSNMTMIQCFSASTGLMIGMSMTDRNLRRLLHALNRTQLSTKQYVILKTPEPPLMSKCDIEEVNARAVKYAQRFAGSGRKQGGKPGRAMQAILHELVRQEKTIAEMALGRMGVEPIWVQRHEEVPVLVEAVGR